MAEKGKGRMVGGNSTTDKLGEADVLNLVLDYLATKGFVEAEQTLRQSVSASGGSPKKQSSNQQSGTTHNRKQPPSREPNPTTPKKTTHCAPKWLGEHWQLVCALGWISASRPPPWPHVIDRVLSA